jgi:hypothetical protein
MKCDVLCVCVADASALQACFPGARAPWVRDVLVASVLLRGPGTSAGAGNHG